MQSQSPILAADNLSITFPGVQPFVAVNKVSFSINEGQTLAIVGESGSGKSLTALSLMGLLPKAATVDGNIEFHTKTGSYSLHNARNSWQHIRGKEIGMIFQEPMSSLNPVMRIGRQLSEVIQTHNNISGQAAKIEAINWLRKVQLPNPEKIYDRYPHQLSGGQKQRVMIAMAMCNNPALLIADEPTTALDVTVQQEIIKLMQELQHTSDTAMIFITHDLALAATIADKMLVMYKGQVVEYGNTQEIIHNPQHPYTQALLACRPTKEQKGKRLPTVADFMDGTNIGNATSPTPTIATNEPLLQVQDLRVWFTEERNLFGKPLQYFKAVDGVSFELNKGEVLGLVGESGCGKSTLSRSLMGLIPVHSGQILYKGKDIAGLDAKGWRDTRRQIQMIFQDPYASLNPRMTIGDMLMEPMRVHHIVPTKQLKQEALRLLALVHLPADSFKRYPHQFSGGQRQRLGIARALALRPQLLICDESVSALDISIQAQILNLLKELQQEFQLTYLFISHDLSVVHYISDRVLVMQAGAIVEQGEATQVLQQPSHPYTRKLIDAMP